MDAPRRGSVGRWSPRRDQDDPAWKSVELAQRGRMILDVCAADLEAAEAAHGAFHAVAWHFRGALAEARRSWDRLRAEFGGAALEAALGEPPAAVLPLGEGDPPPALAIVIGGKTYAVQAVPGTAPAPVQWRLTRLPAHEDGPYYVCRLRDGSTQCDCAEWTYKGADNGLPAPCKHVAALADLGWI